MNAKRIITLLLPAVMAAALLGCNAVNTTPTPTIGNEATPTPPLTPTITAEPSTPIPTPTPAPTKDVSAMPEQAVFTELFSIPVGKGKNEIGYMAVGPLYVPGPTAFYANEDGWIAILDPNRGRIMIFDDNKLAHILDLSDELSYPYHMCYADDGFYIVDIGYEYILYAAFTMEDVGEIDCETKVYELPEETTALLIIDIYATKKGVILSGSDSDHFRDWILDLKRGEFIPTDDYIEYIEEYIEEGETGETIIRTLGDEWHVPRERNCSFDIYGIDKYGFIYVGYYEDFYAEVGAVTLEKTIRCYNSKGRQFGVARIDMDKYSSFLNMDTVVLEDGTIYHMACYEDRITIYEVTLGQRYETRKEELIERAIQKREEAQRRTADPDAP